MTTYIINAGAILIVVIGFWRYYLLSKGAKHLHSLYLWQILAGVINLATIGLLIYINPSMWGMGSFQALTLWSIIMSIRGLMTLKKENKCVSQSMKVI